MRPCCNGKPVARSSFLERGIGKCTNLHTLHLNFSYTKVAKVDTLGPGAKMYGWGGA